VSRTFDITQGKTLRRVFSKINIEIFNNQLKNVTWQDAYLQTDGNRAYSFFLTKYLKYFVNIFLSPKFSKNKQIRMVNERDESIRARL
jgi:hypothetical protein